MVALVEKPARHHFNQVFKVNITSEKHVDVICPLI